jgi:hypothetical protein
MKNILKHLILLVFFALFIAVIILQTMILRQQSRQPDVRKSRVPYVLTEEERAKARTELINYLRDTDGIGPASKWLIAMYVTKDLDTALYFSEFIEPFDKYEVRGYAYEMAATRERKYYYDAIQSYSLATGSLASSHCDAMIGRCYFRLDELDKARYHYALAVVKTYDAIESSMTGSNKTKEIINEWVYVQICRHIINSKYNLRSPFFDSRVFVIFLKQRNEDESPEHEEVYSRAISIVNELFGQSGPVVFDDPTKN